MEILNSAVLLANEHQSDQKNVTNDFRINFRYVFVHAKNDSANGMPENVHCSINEDFNQTDSLSIS